MPPSSLTTATTTTTTMHTATGQTHGTTEGFQGTGCSEKDSCSLSPAPSEENCDNDGGNDGQSDSELCSDGCSEVVQQTGEMVRRITTGTASPQDSQTAGHDEGAMYMHMYKMYIHVSRVPPGTFLFGGNLKALHPHI